jgi:hypothetical protein
MIFLAYVFVVFASCQYGLQAIQGILAHFKITPNMPQCNYNLRIAHAHCSGGPVLHAGSELKPWLNCCLVPKTKIAIKTSKESLTNRSFLFIEDCKFIHQKKRLRGLNYFYPCRQNINCAPK